MAMPDRVSIMWGQYPTSMASARMFINRHARRSLGK